MASSTIANPKEIVTAQRFDTRDETKASYVQTVNQNFLANGHVDMIDFGKILLISIQGRSTKSSQDWILTFIPKYRPYQSFYFPYYLGNTLCRGYIDNNGNMYFETLNTSDFLSVQVALTIA